MTIYIDVTESRAGSRLAEAVQKVAHPVIGLERQTGCDLMITDRGSDMMGNVLHPPGSLQLQMYLKHAWLVQRKSGGDLLNSIPHLRSILTRMRTAGDMHGARSILLCCGEYERNGAGKVICDRMPSGWAWESLQGALEMWQLLGGHVSLQPTDDVGGETLLRWDRNIDKWTGALAGVSARPDIELDAVDPRRWKQVLMAFPGVGPVMADKIADHNPTLADALCWMTYPGSYGVPGIGEKSLQNWHAFAGLKEGEGLLVAREQPTVNGGTV
jgi:hypothetical protein